MLIGSSNLIEVFTLVTAIVAAIGGVTAAVFSAVMAGRQNHRQWLRDLRVRVDGEAIASADKLADSVADLIARIDRENDKAARLETMVELIDKMVDPAVEVFNRLKDAGTFGSKDVAITARIVAAKVNETLLELTQQDLVTTESVQLNEFRKSLGEFRNAVRNCSHIPDD